MIPLWAIKLCAAAALITGAWVHGYTHGKGSEQRRRLVADAEAARIAEIARDKKDSELLELRTASAKQLEKARAENRQLRDRTDLGSVGLRVRADCSTAMPSTFPASSGSAGAGAELAADARPAYHALREGIALTESRLSACQAELRALVE